MLARGARYHVRMALQTTRRMLSVETPEAVAIRYPLASIGTRGLAAAIDIAMLGLLLLGEVVVVALAIFVAVRLEVPLPLDALAPWAIAALIVAAFVTYWGYFIFGEVFRNGRTLGKRLMRIRVVRDDGSRIAVLDSVIRNVVRAIDILPGTYGVGIASMVLSPQAKRLGDMAAGTVVVVEAGRATLAGPLGPAEELDSHVAAFLARRPALSPEARWQVGVELLAAYGEQPGPGWDEPVLAGRLADLAGERAAG